MSKNNNQNGINVLSLFDGMSCGQIALNNLGVKINHYYSSEIDKNCNKLVKEKFPNTIQLGDITKLTEEQLKSLPKIDLLIGGSPCQGFSIAGKQLNFNDPRSKLFFDYVKVLEIIKPTYFLLENVIMKKEYENIITQYLKVEPVLIDSALVSAQQRKRLYWANFKIEQPQEIEANLSDIIDLSLPLNNPLTKEVLLDLNQHEFKDDPKKLEDFIDTHNNLRILKALNRANITGRRLDENGKRKDYNKSLPISQTLEVRNSNLEKSTCLTTVPKSNVLTCLPIGTYRDAFKRKLPFRYYSWQEMAKLQTVDPNYFLNSKNELIVPQTSIKHMLGNGWTVDVISHIFSFLPIFINKEN